MICSLLFAACQPVVPQPADAPWVYADLRAFDELDAADARQELVAAYARSQESELQIRLDLLELSGLPDGDLFLALNTGPGGNVPLPLPVAEATGWDLYIEIPTHGDIQAWGAQSGEWMERHRLGIRVVRQPQLDTIEISLRRAGLGPLQPGSSLMVVMTEPGTSNVVDVLGPFLAGRAPPSPARVLFAFSNVFPAYTPAQALRRWDGAHTGPSGGRHGLYNLLRTAQAARAPLVLLDLQTAASLAALDLAGGLPFVRSLQQEGLLVLPTQAGATGFDSAAFSLAAGNFVYDHAGEKSHRAGEVLFSPCLATNNATPGLTYPFRQADQRVISLGLYPSEPQAGLEGPSLEVKRLLVSAALASDTGAILVLGGDLPGSTWGSPQPARASFHYLAAHPWVQLLSPAGLAGLPVSTRITPCITKPSSRLSIVEPLLNQAPVNTASLAARQAYASLVSPVYPIPPELAALRQVYGHQVQALLAAARWAASPAPQQTCDADPDGDGAPECVLASRQVFAVLEPQGGTLVLLFGHDESGLHQLVAPSSQFAVGLSEASEWNLDLGLAADPAVIPGGFYEPGSSWRNPAPLYTPTLSGGEILLQSTSGMQKRFRLLEDGLRVEIQPAPGQSAFNLLLPLALDPWVRFGTGWANRYQATPLPTGWVWGIQGGPWVSVTSSEMLELQAFTSSLGRFGQPEDPNIDPPPGYYLPLPLAVVSAPGDSPGWIEIRLSTQQE